MLGAPTVPTAAAFVEVQHGTHNEGLGEGTEPSSPTPGELQRGCTGLTCRWPPMRAQVTSNLSLGDQRAWPGSSQHPGTDPLGPRAGSEAQYGGVCEE